MGGMNYHVDITFNDGSVWIARIRRFNATSPPPQLRDHIIQSEVATLKFLEQTRVPTPRVYDFALEGSPGNDVGVGYILMEKLPGKSLRWCSPEMTPERRRKVISQLADIYTELYKYPFDRVGSLDRPSGEAHVGAFARESLTDFTESGIEALSPFSDWEKYNEASIKLILKLIRSQEMYSQRPVDAYIIHLYLLDIMPTVKRRTSVSLSAQSRSTSRSDENSNNDNRFYLKHADEKGDQILVDDDYNITGIIDWEWAYTAPPAHAFNSPIVLLPVGEFYEGVNTLGADEVTFADMLEEKDKGGSKELAGYVCNGRAQHRFTFCCGYDLVDWSGFLGLFRGLRDAVGVDAGLEWEAWREVAMERYGCDEGLKMLRERVDSGV